jgi:hypothetical protein
MTKNKRQKPVKQEEPEISREWFLALSNNKEWTNYNKPGEFPITIKYTFDLTCPHNLFGADGKGYSGQPITKLTKEAMNIVRQKLRRWEDAVGEYFHFKEIPKMSPTDFVSGSDSEYTISNRALNTLHFFYHGEHSKGVPTGGTVVEDIGGKVRFSVIGLASDIEKNAIDYFERVVEHEILHLWEKHPVQYDHKDIPPFIPKNKILESCNQTGMLYYKDCKPVNDCIDNVPVRQSVVHCYSLFPKGPFVIDVATVKRQYDPKYAKWKDGIVKKTSTYQVKRELGPDYVANGTKVLTSVSGVVATGLVQGSVSAGASVVNDVAYSHNPVLVAGGTVLSALFVAYTIGKLTQSPGVEDKVRKLDDLERGMLQKDRVAQKYESKAVQNSQFISNTGNNSHARHGRRF